MGEESGRIRRVCVTGANGFMASCLVKHLLHAGYHVRGTVRNLGKAEHLRALPGAKERLDLVQANLMDEGSFDAALIGCEGVFHTATPVIHPKLDPQAEMIEPAIKGTLNVLRSCKKTPSIKKVIVTSSSSAVRMHEDIDPNVPLDESSWSSLDFCYKLKMWYAISKILAEKAAWDFATENNLDMAVILPTFIVGHSLPPNLGVTTLDILNLLKGESSTFALYGRMGYVHIDDVATTHIRVYEEPSAKGRFICSSLMLENHELAEFLRKRYPHLNTPLEFESFGERPYYNFNTSKVKKLGITFKGLEEMFDDCLATFKEKGLL